MVSELSRHLSSKNIQEKEFAERKTSSIAELDDGTKLRITPEKQKKVDELIRVGDTIKTNYGDNLGVVLSVTPYEVYGLTTFSIVYVPKEKINKYRKSDYHYINELVAMDNRVLKLFEVNTDEVFLVKKKGIYQHKLTIA
jgi:hypothetical protein